MRFQPFCFFFLLFSCRQKPNQDPVAQTCTLYSDLPICLKIVQDCEKKKEQGGKLDRTCQDLIQETYKASIPGSTKNLSPPQKSTSQELVGLSLAFDVGHGCDPNPSYGCEDGAIGHGVIVEREHNKAQTQIAKDLLERKGANVTVYECDEPLASCSLIERSRRAQAGNHDLLISVHNNAASPTAQGSEVWTKPHQEKSAQIADFVNQAINQAVWGGASNRNRGVKHNHKLTVLENTTEKHSIILTEGFFVTGSELKSQPQLADRYSVGVGTGIAEGVIKWFQNQNQSHLGLFLYQNVQVREWKTSELPVGMRAH